MHVTIDFETRSPVDLANCGTFVYANHPLTEIMCLSLSVDDHPPLLWIPDKFYSDNLNLDYARVSEEMMLELVEKSDLVIAFNTMFEYLMWNRVGTRRGWPELSLYKMHDVMAQCGYYSLPQKLDLACKVLNLPAQKDQKGHKAMLKLCKPRRALKVEREQLINSGILEDENKIWYHLGSDSGFCLWHEDVEDLEILFNYCGKDVAAERCLFNAVPPLPEYERQVWILDQEINLRGVKIDYENVEAIVAAIEEDNEKQLIRFTELTGGQVNSPRSYPALKSWVNDRVLGTGIPFVDSVDKVATEELLARPELPDLVREVLQIKSELSKSSVSKFKAMLNRVDTDHRLKGMFQYGGAGTLRWAGRGVQLHNLIRESYNDKEWETLAEFFKARDLTAVNLLFEPAYFAASKMVRGSLIADEGMDIVCADFSSVEGVGLAYLSGEQYVLDAYRDGLSMYKIAAQGIFNVGYDDVTKDQRQVGKVSELAFGYGGGIGAYASMAAGYKIDLETLPPFVLPTATQEEWKAANNTARGYVRMKPKAMSLDAAIACDIIKRRWRAKRPMTVQFWHGIEHAVISAVMNPGQVYRYRDIAYVVQGRFLKCQLPGGRIMHYCDPDIRHMKRHKFDTEGHAERCMCEECARWEETLSYMGMKTVEGKTTTAWVRTPTYGGSLVENIVQASCRDLLAQAMLNVKKAGYNIILHVHDELAVEAPEGSGKRGLDQVISEMLLSPAWARGMPLSADGWVGKRYRK